MDFKPSILIGPHYTSDNLNINSLEDRIALFEDRIRGYYTTPARLLINLYENSALIILLIVTTCVELLEIFHQGQSSKDKTGIFFKSGIRRIFRPARPDFIPEIQFEEDLNKVLKELYKQVRCGLVHTGTTRSNVIVTTEIGEPLRVDFNQQTKKVQCIQINPIILLISVDFHVSEYCSELRNQENEDLRQKFNQAWETLIAEE